MTSIYENYPTQNGWYRVKVAFYREGNKGRQREERLMYFFWGFWVRTGKEEIEEWVAL